MNDPLAQQELAELGARAVPVLAAGGQYIFCQNLEDVAEFVGLQGTGHVPLAPEVLVTKWLGVLCAGFVHVVLAAFDVACRLIEHHPIADTLLYH